MNHIAFVRIRFDRYVLGIPREFVGPLPRDDAQTSGTSHLPLSDASSRDASAHRDPNAAKMKNY